jgi:hypothetical protein
MNNEIEIYKNNSKTLTVTLPESIDSGYTALFQLFENENETEILLEITGSTIEDYITIFDITAEMNNITPQVYYYTVNVYKDDLINTVVSDSYSIIEK